MKQEGSDIQVCLNHLKHHINWVHSKSLGVGSRGLHNKICLSKCANA